MRLFFILTVLTSFLANDQVFSQSPMPPAPLEKDLALFFPLNPEQLIAFDSPLSQGPAHFPAQWYEELSSAFEESLVGQAFAEESPFESWRLVSMRVVPCQPLGRAIFHDQKEICWPEIRLVWQSIQKGATFEGRVVPLAADDRAIHVTYPIDPSRFLASDETVRARTYLKTLESMIGSISGFFGLPSDQKADFSKLQRKVTSELTRELLALRDESLAQDSYRGLGQRPEFSTPALAATFKGKLENFLGEYARPDAVKTLAAFSIPAGRRPRSSNQWIFLSFKGKSGETIARDPIVLWSFDTNIPYFNGTHQLSGSMDRDDDTFYKDTIGEAQKREIAKAVMLGNGDKSRLVPILSDRRKMLVPNTSCVSCHKINSGNPDVFHSMSYFINGPISISPRVRQDVQYDLEFLMRIAPQNHTR